MHFFFPLSLLLLGTSAHYDTALEKKCATLIRSHETAAYVEGTCYVALKEKHSTTRDQWKELHLHCKMLNGYKGHLATIPSRDYLKKLAAAGAVKQHGKYYVGGRQDPIPPCLGNGGTCTKDSNETLLNWYFFDDNMKSLMPISPDLWMSGEPGNQNPPESIAILESYDSYGGGLNDANPGKENYQPLCQFVDYLECTDGYILIRDRCYKIHPDAKNAASAKSTCENEGGLLASIHDDAMNGIIIDYARERITPQITIPIRFGLKYGSKWANDDATPSDYFRWFKEEGCGKPTVFKNGGVGAALGVYAGSRDPDPSYWKIVKDSDNLPFLCSKNPTSRYTRGRE